MILTIDPRGLTVTEWTDWMNFPLSPFLLPRRLDNPEHWTEWALQVIEAPKIAVLNPPDPRGFSDWRDWAFRFNQVLAQ